MPYPLLVQDRATLVEVADALRGGLRLALDTEGNGMHAYAARLCVIQLCLANDEVPTDTVFVLDTLAIGDLSPLAPLLGAGGPRKLIHDVAFDARLLARAGLPLGNVQDTSQHARFLGLRETGLSALLASRHGVSVSKTFQQDDWAKRPLRPEQLGYLADDVAYLGPLAAGLAREAGERGISEEIAAETDYALANALADERSSLPAYARIKGANKLPPTARAVLRELVAVRDAAAERWDVPAGRVISGDGLIQTAKARPATMPELRRAAGLRDRAATLGEALLEAVRRGEAAGDVPAEERAFFAREIPAGPEIAARKARDEALSAWRTKESEARGVDLQVVLPGHALADLVRLRPRTLEGLAEVPGLGAVRVRRDGAALLALLDAADAGTSPTRRR